MMRRAVVVCLVVLNLVVMVRATSTTVNCCTTSAIITAIASYTDITLGPGTFTGGCTSPPLSGSASFTITGAGASSTIIDCQHTGNLFNVPSTISTMQLSAFAIINGLATSTTPYGGCFSSGGPNTILRNMRLQGCTATTRGGAFDVSGLTSTLVLSNVVFQSNFVTLTTNIEGAAFFSNAPIVSMDGCTFQNNTGSYGIVNLNPNGGYLSVNVTNSRFMNNYAGSLAALTTPNSHIQNLFLSDCIFTGNSGMHVIYIPGLENTATVQNLLFSQNLGVAVWPAQPLLLSFQSFNTLNINNITVQDNVARATGGTVDLTSGTTLTIINSRFLRNNNVNGSCGGGLTVWGASAMTIQGCTFDSNSVDGIGGHARIISVTNGLINNCTFLRGFAPSVGALHLYAQPNAYSGLSTIAVTNCVFIANNASLTGAVYIESVNTTISGCTLRSNLGGTGGGSDAAGISFVNSYFLGRGVLQNVTFENNVGTAVAGALSARGLTAISISGCTFRGNTAGSVSAAIFTPGSGSMTSVAIGNGTTFSNNYSPVGAVNIGAGGLFTMSNAVFTNNTATSASVSEQFGAALFVVSSSITIDACSFTGNTGPWSILSLAPLAGNMIFSVTNTVFTSNSAGSLAPLTIVNGLIPSFNIANCVFTGNTGQYGAISFFGGITNGANGTMQNIIASSNIGGRFGPAPNGGNLIGVGNFGFITATNLTMTDNYQNRSAGLVSFGTGVSVTVTNSIFLRNYNLDSCGGGITVGSVTSLSMQGCTFDNNTATGIGGHARLIRVTNIAIADSTFARGVSNGVSGVHIYTDHGQTQANAVITNCLFVGNSGAGAILFESSNATIVRSNFTSNVGVLGTVGAAVKFRGYGPSQTLNVANSTFAGNLAVVSGGAISVEGASGCVATVSVSGSTLTNNTALTNGGAIWTDLTGATSFVWTTYILQSTFTSNSAPQGQGGAVYMASSGSLIVTGSAFNNNTASDGGAMELNSFANIAMTNATFDANSVSHIGGALRVVTATTMTLTSCQFTRGKASQGGAMEIYGTALTVSGSQFISNSAINFNVTGLGPTGGCFLLQYSNATLVNSLLQGCVSQGDAGGVYFCPGSGPGTLLVTNAQVLSNTAAGAGGGIFLGGGTVRTVTVSNSIFSDNTATTGGGFYSSPGSATSVTLAQTTFTRNKAVTGAGMAVSATSTTITGSTFTLNTATGNGGGISAGSSPLSIQSASLFDSNTATGLGGAVYTSGASPSTVSNDTKFTNNNVAGGPAALEAYFNGGSGCTQVPGNYAFNPAIRGCPGVVGYNCAIVCPRGTIASRPGTVTCPAPTMMDNVTCVPDLGIVKSTWAASNGATNYGTKGVASPTNMINSRMSSIIIHDASAPNLALIVGGFGDDMSLSGATGGLWLDDTWLVDTTDYANPIVTWIAGSNCVDTNYPESVYSGPGVRMSSRYNSMGWIYGGTAYLFGGYEKSCIALGDLWTLDLSNPSAGWTPRVQSQGSRYATGPVYHTPAAFYGLLHVGNSSTHPGGRFRSATWQIPQKPGYVFLYGGAGGVGLADLWMLQLSPGIWTWIGGPAYDTGNSVPSYGTIRVPSNTNWPGPRQIPSMFVSNGTTYMYGGYVKPNGRVGYNDLWSATYNAAACNFTWTWIGGPAGWGQAASRGSASTYCTGCYPPSYNGANVLVSEELLNGGMNTFFVYGGDDNVPTGFYPHEETWAIRINSSSMVDAMWVAGNIADSPPSVTPTFKGPLTPGVPFARAFSITWPDHARPGDYYVLGADAYAPNMPRLNQVFRISTITTADATPPTLPSEVGVPFSISVRLGQAGVWATGLNLPHVSVSAFNALTGAPGNVALSGTVVSGLLSLSVTGPMSGGNVTVYTLNITLNDHVMTLTNVTLRCTTGCSTCTARGLGVAVCSSCNNSAGYVFDPVSQTCNTTCGGGYYKTPTACARCTAGCLDCSSATLSNSACTCDTANGYGLDVPTQSCVACHTPPQYISGLGECKICPNITNCAATVSCTDPSSARCTTCANGFYRAAGGAGVPDTCVACRDCPSGTYIQADCVAASVDNRICATCAACGDGTFQSSPCNTPNNFTNTVCTACTPVDNCISRQQCTQLNITYCSACASGTFASGNYPTNTSVCTVCSVCPLGTYQVVPCQANADSACATCDAGCANCTRPGLTSATCTACDESVGYRWNAAGTACVDHCEASEFLSPRNATTGSPAQCVACTTGCVTCSAAGLSLVASDGISAGVCQVCDETDGYLISPALTCRDGCPTGYFGNYSAEPQYCVSCSGSTCQAGFYRSCTDPTDAKCSACTKGCKTCTGDGLSLEEYCLSCDESIGYAASDDGTACVPCAANCTLCSGSPTHCTVCADGYGTAPGCAPVCTSQGCLGCQSPEACLLCAPTFQGGDCKTCSGQAQVGAAYPDCIAARQTDTTSTGASLGLLLALGIFVTVIALAKPLPIFYTGVDEIYTPSQTIPLKVDFVLSKQRLQVTIHPPAPINKVTLEGAGLLPGSVDLNKTEDGTYATGMTMTNKQTAKFLSRQMKVAIVADAGAGPVETEHVLTVPLRRSSANFIAVFTILLDFVQLSAFGFGGTIQWWRKDPVPSSLHYTLIQLPSVEGLWYLIYWVLVGLAALWVLICIFLKSGLDAKMSRSAAYRSASGAIYSFFMPVVGQTLYLPIITTMLGAMACSKPVTDLTSPFTASYDDKVICWEGSHLMYVIVAAIIIVIYYPLAVYTSPMWQTINPFLDVRYFGSYLVVSGQVKFVLAVTTQLFGKVAYLPSILLIVLPLPVVLMVLRRPPCIIYSLRWPIAASYASVTWSGIASLVALQYPNVWLSSVILYAGWFVLFSVGLVVALRPASNPNEKNEVASGGEALRRILAGDQDEHRDAFPAATMTEKPVVVSSNDAAGVDSSAAFDEFDAVELDALEKVTAGADKQQPTRAAPHVGDTAAAEARDADDKASMEGSTPGTVAVEDISTPELARKPILPAGAKRSHGKAYKARQ